MPIRERMGPGLDSYEQALRQAHVLGSMTMPAIAAAPQLSVAQVSHPLVRVENGFKVKT